MQSANLSGPFRGCLYYALLGLPQATGLAGGYDYYREELTASSSAPSVFIIAGCGVLSRWSPLREGFLKSRKSYPEN